MTQQVESGVGLTLSGLDGANPLAFLAALGVLRGLTIAWPERRVRMSWKALDAWRPVVHADGENLTQGIVLDGLDEFLAMRPGHEALSMDNNLNVSASKFRQHALRAKDRSMPETDGRAEADFIMSFGCEVVADEKGVIRDTALRTLSGAGHQHFLKTMRDLTGNTTRESLIRCLFGPWTRPDSRLSLRWDPEDDRRYALRWRDPTAAGEQPRTEWGANRLAFEALPLFPVMPTQSTAKTTGLSGRGSRDTFLTWPLWEAACDLDTVRSLLALRELQEPNPDRMALQARGIREVFRSQRLTLGKYRNFSPAKPA